MFLIVEALIFRAGWYENYLEPQSSAGTVETYLYWLTSHRRGSTPEVLVVGDSRIAEGFSAPGASEAAGNRIHFWNYGVGGATPRVWYYELRDADPTRRRFAAIAIAMDHYSDADGVDSIADRVIDLNFVIGRLRLTDCPDFAFSLQMPEYRAKALAGCFLKGIPLRRDAQEFLLRVRDRVHRAKNNRALGLGYIDAYPGRKEDLRGLTADFETRTIRFPPGLDAERHDTVEDRVMPDRAPQTGELTEYRKRWLGRILDLYRNSPTRIIFLELPRAPLPIPEDTVPPRFLDWALKRPGVSALPAGTFRDLERPELFFDGLHLNRAGRELFTARIAAGIAPRIGIH